MKKIAKFALCAAMALAFASCGQSPKDAAKEAYDIMMESNEMALSGDTEGAAAKMTDYNKIVNKYADDKEFAVELSRLVTEGIEKQGAAAGFDMNVKNDIEKIGTEEADE